MPSDFLNYYSGQENLQDGTQVIFDNVTNVITRRNCCSTDCTVRPGFIRLTIDINDDANIVYGDSNNFNYFDFSIGNAGDSCDENAPENYEILLSTESAQSYDEYIKNILYYFNIYVYNLGGHSAAYLNDSGEIVVELNTENFSQQNGINFCENEHEFLFCQYKFADGSSGGGFNSENIELCDCPDGFYGGVIAWDSTIINNIISTFGQGQDIQFTQLLTSLGIMNTNIVLNDNGAFSVNTSAPNLAELLASGMAEIVLQSYSNEISNNAPNFSAFSYFEDGVWKSKICIPLVSDSLSNFNYIDGTEETHCSNPDIENLSILIESQGGEFVNVPVNNVKCGCDICKDGKVCYYNSFGLNPANNLHNFTNFDAFAIEFFDPECYFWEFPVKQQLPFITSGGDPERGSKNVIIMLNHVLQYKRIDSDLEIYYRRVGNTYHVSYCLGLGNDFQNSEDDKNNYNCLCSAENSVAARQISFRFDSYGGNLATPFFFSSTTKDLKCCNSTMPKCLCPPNSLGGEIEINVTEIFNNTPAPNSLVIDNLSINDCYQYIGQNGNNEIPLNCIGSNDIDQFAACLGFQISQFFNNDPYFNDIKFTFFVDTNDLNEKILKVKFCYTPIEGFLDICCNSRNQYINFDITTPAWVQSPAFSYSYSTNNVICCTNPEIPFCDCPTDSHTTRLFYKNVDFYGNYSGYPNAPYRSQLNLNGIGSTVFNNTPFNSPSDFPTDVVNTQISELISSGFPRHSIARIENLNTSGSPELLVTYCTPYRLFEQNNIPCDSRSMRFFTPLNPFEQTINGNPQGARVDFESDVSFCCLIDDFGGEPSPENPDFVVNLSENSDCCEKECPNPDGYFSSQIKLTIDNDDSNGRYNLDSVVVTVCGQTLMNQSNLYLTTEGKSPEETAARFQKFVNTNLYDDYFVNVNGSLITLYIKNSQNLDCECAEGSNITVSYVGRNGNEIILNESLNCCNSQSATSQIDFDEQNLSVNLSQNVLCCPDFAVGLELVNCCSDEVLSENNFDISNCIDCYSSGRNVNPISYFQNTVFDVDCIPFDCFAFKFTGPNGETFYSECYEKVICEKTLTFCATYPDKFIDCLGNVYGLPDEIGCACGEDEDEFAVFENCFKVQAEMTLEQINFEFDENDRRISNSEYRILTQPIPPYVVEQIRNVFTSRNAFIQIADGEFYEYEFEGSVSRNIEGSKMWVLDFLVKRVDECVNSFGCE